MKQIVPTLRCLYILLLYWPSIYLYLRKNRTSAHMEVHISVFEQYYSTQVLKASYTRVSNDDVV